MWLIILIVAVCIVWAIISIKNDEEKAKEQQKKNAEYAQQRVVEYKCALSKLDNKIDGGRAIDKQPMVTVATVGYRENVYYLPTIFG